jgi:NagD protein
MTNKKAYFIGKPNPLIMTESMKILGTNTSETVIIGDRMDTDIIAGTELGIDTVLLLSGVTKKDDVKNWAFKPDIILDSVGELVPENEEVTKP